MALEGTRASVPCLLAAALNAAALPAAAPPAALGVLLTSRLRSPPVSRWCCTEFATARYCKIIANLDSPAVQLIEQERRWPETVREYEVMMREGGGIEFTGKGDRAITRYLFFKMAYNLSGENFRLKQPASQLPAVLQEGRLWSRGRSSEASAATSTDVSARSGEQGPFEYSEASPASPQKSRPPTRAGAKRASFEDSLSA